MDQSLDLLDTPGILWPKFDDEQTGLHLAFTGAVKDDIMDVETLGCHLMTLLAHRYPDALMAGYKLAALPPRMGRKMTWPMATDCWRPAHRSGGCGFPGGAGYRADGSCPSG